MAETGCFRSDLGGVLSLENLETMGARDEALPRAVDGRASSVNADAEPGLSRPAKEPARLDRPSLNSSLVLFALSDNREGGFLSSSPPRPIVVFGIGADGGLVVDEELALLSAGFAVPRVDSC